jgi:hypothetical protein
VIALRFPRRDEEQCDAQVQREAHESAEDSGSASQAGDRGLVIKLQQVRNASLRAALQQVGPGRGRAFV